MHVAHVTTPTQWGPTKLEAGKYLVEDHNAAELLYAGGGCGNVTLRHQEVAFRCADWRHASFVNVVRVGGFGDLLWLNAIYAEMKRQRPELRIRHACFSRYAPVLNGFVDEVLPYPLPTLDAPIYGFTPIWLENIIEEKPCLDGEHPCDRIARYFGLDPLPRKSAYRMSAKESKRAIRAWPRTSRRRVCLQVESSTGNKSYPEMQELFSALVRAGYEILVVGDPSPDDQIQPKIVFNARKMSLGIRDSIAMASHCDVIVGSDSVFVHVGAALDIPVVGLFGPFDGATYMTGQRGTVLQGRKACSPCSHHPRGMIFPAGQDCAKSLVCEALQKVLVADVLAAVGEWVGNTQVLRARAGDDQS